MKQAFLEQDFTCCASSVGNTS